jgi:hypothetical protein
MTDAVHDGRLPIEGIELERVCQGTGVQREILIDILWSIVSQLVMSSDSITPRTA